MDLDKTRIIHLRTKRFPTVTVSLRVTKNNVFEGGNKMTIKTSVLAVVSKSDFYE